MNEPQDLEGIQTPWNPRFLDKVEEGSVSPALTQKQEGISDECQLPAYQQMSRLCSEQVWTSGGLRGTYVGKQGRQGLRRGGGFQVNKFEHVGRRGGGHMWLTNGIMGSGHMGTSYCE